MSVTVEWIRNDDDLETANKRLYSLRDAKEGTPESEEWNVLADLIEAYERRHIPMDLKVVAASFKDYVEKWGLDQKEIARARGDRARASELMSGKRLMTVAQMQRLHERFRFPYEELMAFTRQAEQRAS